MTVTKWFLVLSCLPGLTTSSGLRAQEVAPDPPSPTVSQARPLVDGPPPFPAVETYLAVNPADPENLLASAMSVSASESVVYASRDGGSTWRQVESPEGPTFPGGDPMLAFDETGRAYFSTIAPGIHVWRSDDGGRTWAGPSLVGPDRAADRQWVVASGVGGDGSPRLLVAAKTVETAAGRRRDLFLLSSSRDGGRSFTEPELLPPDSGYLNSVTDLVVTGDGTLLMPYLVNYARISEDPQVIRGRRWIRISGDRGRSWSGPHPVAENLQYGNGTWSRAMRGLGAGNLAVDESGGPHDGTAYMTWAAVLGEQLQIVLARSPDGGRSWQEPVRVNDAGFDSDHSMPTVAVNRHGVVAVTWNDRRHDPEDRCFRHYAAVSVDGGKSFGPNRRVSDVETCPGPRSRWLNGGDTQGLASLPDGSFRTVWSVGEPEGLRPWTAVIRTR